MSEHLKEKLERLQQIVTQLIEESISETLIVVEGQKDLNTLRQFGVSGKILAIKVGGKSLTTFLQEIEQSPPQRLILLLDFDRRGREMTAKFKQELEHERIKVDLTFWRAIRALAGREIQCIESLTSYLQTLEQKSAKM